jgi:hypothetical protein
VVHLNSALRNSFWLVARKPVGSNTTHETTVVASPEAANGRNETAQKACAADWWNELLAPV